MNLSWLQRVTGRRRRVSLLHCATPHHGGQAVQESGECDGVDLEAAASGGVHLPPTHRGGVAACHLCGRAVSRWGQATGKARTEARCLPPTTATVFLDRQRTRSIASAQEVQQDVYTRPADRTKRTATLRSDAPADRRLLGVACALYRRQAGHCGFARGGPTGEYGPGRSYGHSH